MAEKLDISRGYYAQIEKGHKELTHKVIRSISESFYVSSDWLLFGETLSAKSQSDVHLSVHPNVHPSAKSSEIGVHQPSHERGLAVRGRQREPNVTLIPVRVQAGYAQATEMTVMEYEVQQFYWPGVRRGTYAFEVEGDSMYPTLEAGDYVFCEQVLELSDLKENALYVVVWDGNVAVKRLRTTINGLHLHSDNPSFSTIDLPPDGYKELWAVRFKFTKRVDQQTAQDERIDRIEEQLAELQRRLDTQSKSE
jgi:phage repressor protein C with HTH and peptisase S24 domain